MANHRQVQRDKGSQLLLGSKLGKVVFEQEPIGRKGEFAVVAVFISASGKQLLMLRQAGKKPFQVAGYVSFHEC